MVFFMDWESLSDTAMSGDRAPGLLAEDDATEN
jgi:hypothetical protein